MLLNRYIPVACAVFVAMPGVALASALPVDPQRPFTAQTCDAALARLDEAKAGNPLISAAEMAQVVTQARIQAMRLCGPDYDQMTNSTGPHLPAAKGE